MSDDTGRRCPRCDCPDGHTQCEHCKICPHATDATQGPVSGSNFTVANSQVYWLPPPPPNITIVGEDGRPLVTIHPSGELEYGPGYTPDEAASRFWDALRRLAPARCPACGHIGMEGQ